MYSLVNCSKSKLPMFSTAQIHHHHKVLEDTRVTCSCGFSPYNGKFHVPNLDANQEEVNLAHYHILKVVSSSRREGRNQTEQQQSKTRSMEWIRTLHIKHKTLCHVENLCQSRENAHIHYYINPINQAASISPFFCWCWSAKWDPLPPQNKQREGERGQVDWNYLFKYPTTNHITLGDQYTLS